MSAGHNEAKLLFSIGNIHAYHLQNGEESSLTPSGPQTLSLLMVPSSSPFTDLSTSEIGTREDDFYLHLHLPPELDMPLPATTQVYHQPPRSYLIPRWDLGPDAGAFTRIEFPKIGSTPDRVSQEDVDTFETILAQCTAFLEKTRAPSGQDLKSYNPADYAPGEGYVSSELAKGRGQIILIDEEDGSVVGELSEGFDVVEGKDVKIGSKKPVEIELPQEGQGNKISVHEVSEDYLRIAKHPAYKNSAIVQNAATASRLIVTGSGYLAGAINSGALAFTQKTKPNPKPMTFSPATQERIRKLNNLTHGAVGLSAATVGQVGKMAQNFGARLAHKNDTKHARNKEQPGAGYKPGVLNKSLIAFSTIADGVEQSAKQLLTSGSQATSTMVAHRYGAEAGKVAGHLAGGVKNVGLVYVDATGVSRKAVIKSVAKGMVVGKMPNDKNLIVGEGDGGQVPQELRPEEGAEPPPRQHSTSTDPLVEQPGVGRVGFGSAAPPSYTSGIGEPLGSGGSRSGIYPDEKRH